MGFLKSVGKALGGVATNALGSLATAGVNSLFAGQSVRNSKKLMRYQNQLNNQNYDKQRKNDLADYERNRKDYVDDLLKADMRAAKSRRNAGLSIAFSNGFTPGQPLGESIKGSDIGAPSASAPMASAPQLFSSQDLLASSQLRLLESQKEKTDEETEKVKEETGKTKNEKELVQMEVDKFKETFEEQVKTISANLQYILTQSNLNNKEIEKKSEEINNLQTQGKLLTFDLEKMKPQELKNLRASYYNIRASIANLNSQTSLNGVETEIRNIEKNFKSMGIGIDSSFFGSLLSVLSAGDGKLVSKLKETISGMFGEITDPLSKIIEEVSDFVSPPATQEELDDAAETLSGQSAFSPLSASAVLHRAYTKARVKARKNKK